MRPIWVLAAVAATAWFVGPAFGWGVIIVGGLWFLYLSLQDRPASPPRPRQKGPGWGFSLGLGLTHFGPFPFVTLYRRRRYRG